MLIVASPGIAAVLGASTTSEATGSDATEPREGRASKSATSEGEAPGGHAPTCCGSGASGTSAGVSASGATAALVDHVYSPPPDDGGIQVPPNHLEPPGAVVEFLDSPG